LKTGLARVGIPETEGIQVPSFILTLAVDDYLELMFYHDDGITQAVLTSNTFFEVYRVY